MERLAGYGLPLLTAVLVLAAANVTAEIVVPSTPDSGQKAKKSASEVRSKAKAYQESASGSPIIVVIPDGAVIGFDREEDLKKGYTVTASGIVVVPRRDK